MARTIKIRATGDVRVSGRLAMPRHPLGTGVLLAHGAGAPQDHPFMVSVRDRLAGAGIATMTFNYAYSDAGRRSPDRLAKLLDVHRAAAERMAGYVDRVVLAGKSMGGRVGAHLAGDAGWPAAGLVYLGYPLVALGKGEPRPTDHLDRIEAPQLFLAGTRDRLSPPDLIVALAARLRAADVFIAAEGDHSFRVPKRSGTTDDVVLATLCDIVAAWVKGRIDQGVPPTT